MTQSVPTEANLRDARVHLAINTYFYQEPDNQAATLKQLEGWGLKISTIEHRGDSALVISADKQSTVIVAFKGVDTVQDLLHTMKDRPVPAPLAGTYAESVDESLTNLSGGKSLMDKIKDTIPHVTGGQNIQDVKLSVSGFSYGGALAQGYAAHLAQQGLKLDGLYAFGAPAIGDKLFVKAFEEWANDNKTNFLRIDREKDPVHRTAHYTEFLSQQLILKPGSNGCVLHNRPQINFGEAVVARFDTIDHLRRDDFGDHNFGLYKTELRNVTGPLKQCTADPNNLNQNDIRQAPSPAKQSLELPSINP